ncbi:MAG: hypothetical protein QM766_17365 [Burkholderiaceae bacterium]
MTNLPSDTRTDTPLYDVRSRSTSRAGRAAVCWAVAAVITLCLSGVLVHPMDSAPASTPAASVLSH